MGLCQLRDPGKPPKRLTDALGGDAMWNTFTAVSAPITIPHGASGGGLDGRVFGFLGLGALARTPCAGLAPLLEGLRSGVRASAGLGLGVPLAGIGTLELTFAYPFRAKPGDL